MTGLLQGGSQGSTKVLELPFKRKSVGKRRLNLSVSAAVAEDVLGQVHRLVVKVCTLSYGTAYQLLCTG